ncbi:hypothetical protein PV08_01926 [Exophiala spinifera]|uniref:Glycosyl transferase family 25 domain-containing protein n=1 Tax=Exophiala spinifera TaxID=91928 RepID=A0A0D1Z109_9EURO|nr:uncharacterized protein PV08_01926 [Exophiala spinifera]KIW21346.1 hypothetical protein PV08_01926 [Exophiala spinifera]
MESGPFLGFEAHPLPKRRWPFLMKYTLVVVTVFVVSNLFFLTIPGSWSTYSDTVRTHTSRSAQKILEHDNLHDVYNDTLGFGKIFVVSLAERTDKQDAISMQARMTNISFDFIEGAVGSQVSQKAQPHTMNRTVPEVGCWRSHLNAMQQMVRKRVRSALIFEDDADWDVGIKHQMLQVARGSRWLLGNRKEAIPHSPYGDGWDVLWIGHCSAEPSNSRRWVIPKDPTVVPPGNRSYWFKPDMERWESAPEQDTQTRLLFDVGLGSCSAAWAVSLAGAEKILYELSMSPFNDAIDMGVAQMCFQKTWNMRCIAPYPTIVGVSKPAGSVDRGSDIREDENMDGTAIRPTAESERLVFSTRQNIPRFLAKEGTFESLFPDVTGQFMSMEDIGSAVGHGELTELRPPA